MNGSGTAVPAQVYTQSEIWDSVQRTGLLQQLDERAFGAGLSCHGALLAAE